MQKSNGPGGIRTPDLRHAKAASFQLDYRPHIKLVVEVLKNFNPAYNVPANLTPEFHKKYMEYKSAKTTTQKIRLLRELIALAPKHKGTEKLLAQLKRTLSKLEKREEAERRAKKRGRKRGIKKVAPLIVIVGPPNSGKTALFRELTGKGEPKPWPYSTQEPETAIGYYNDAKLQFIDCPSFDFSYANNADVILLTKPDETLIEKFSGKKIVIASGKSKEEILREIWKKLDLIRVYTEHGDEPLLLKKGATVEDAAKEIHKQLVEGFEWARVRRAGKIMKVGLDFELEDGDVIWIKSRA